MGRGGGGGRGSWYLEVSLSIEQGPAAKEGAGAQQRQQPAALAQALPAAGLPAQGPHQLPLANLHLHHPTPTPLHLRPVNTILPLFVSHAASPTLTRPGHGQLKHLACR